ncbi:hypothetical protein PBAC_24920 [Pedobacter glucosidilyticus]|uniref:DUF177 domain-containing protein n=1 Tax=Pedobacter aquae TaxID=2605747 RepID=A0A5C0VJV1_9SPHI|nr:MULTISPECIES: DUF177 domain-containing protein [Pedobacter]KHJ37327.1 hypothetical protein PBAC_24920 [Pedobacter glucosidilyticus]QEK52786.1 DUF177 domain-containing protein [Pedobacter aquae]
MKLLKQYSVPFTGLKLGLHQFNFDVDGSFFNEFEYSLVKNGLLKVDLVLDRQETMLVLDFHITGFIYLDCDRCLAEYPQALDTRDRLIAKFSQEDDLEETDEVIVLTKNDVEVDTSTFIYEMITLAAPYINMCDNPGNTDACDKDMIAKLQELSTEDSEDNGDLDPRWAALKNIKK